MPTLNAASLTTLVNDSSIAVATAEAILDAAMNRITAHGYSLSAMPGTSPKTKNVSQAQLGWIQTVAVAIYSKEYKSSGAASTSDSMGGISESSSNSSSSAFDSPDELAEKAAYILSNQSASDWSRAII